ncbi:MAG: DoxX family membrane protein [Alphaproteobacteria bacterium]
MLEKMFSQVRTFSITPAEVAFLLRLGLGLVFLIGGSNKLYQLLDPALEDAILAAYMGPKGYINAFFAHYLFDGRIPFLTPWLFLTSLSFMEFFAGVFLIIGFLTRPVSLVFGLLVWTFVMALPVITTPGVEVVESTYTSPALLVQARDIGLSGLLFVLFNLGAGRFSPGSKFLPQYARASEAGWDALGLLLRLSLALPLLVGGLFWGLANIQNFATPALLLIITGLAIAFNIFPRIFGAIAAAIFVWFIATKINLDFSLIKNLNGFKRELAYIAAAVCFVFVGGGNLFTKKISFSKN